jgi:HlyD family secretion protein
MPVAKAKSGYVLSQIRTLYCVGAIRELSDGQLLERFKSGHSEAAELAFVVLVERHGPMVLRVCRSVLSNAHDTEDAFQATFLVLVKKARKLWVRDSLGPWLHQVAFRTASSARISALRRFRCEERAAVFTRVQPAQSGDDVGAVLHEEIERLPEHFRAPVVLCDLESRTHQQAARHLGWPIGTVKSRLARGRQRLRERLSRRGLSPNASLIAVAERPDGPIANSLRPLIDSTARAAVQLTSTRAITVGSIAALTRAAIRDMLVLRCVKAAALILAVGAAGSAAGLLASDGHSGQDSQRVKIIREPASDNLRFVTAKPGQLSVTTWFPARVVNARSRAIACQVEGQSVIKWVLPDKSAVQGGDLICQLDSGPLRIQAKLQSNALKAAQAAYKSARATRELAELALAEYTTATDVREHKAMEDALAIAVTAVPKAKARTARLRRASQRINDSITSKKGDATPAYILAEAEIETRLELAEADEAAKRATVADSKAKLHRHCTSTRPTTVSVLKAELERARADERAKQATWDLEKTKEAKLNRQIENCNIYAPAGGTISHANDPRGLGVIYIASGEVVVEGQLIVTIPDPTSPLCATTVVPETLLEWIAPGSKARMKFHGIRKTTIDGMVSEIVPMLDVSRFQLPRTVHSAVVWLENPPPGLQPDMKGELSITCIDRADAITVPTQAVLKFHEKNAHVAIKKPSGGFEWREVTLGYRTIDLVEVKDGIRAGDQVLLEPGKLISTEPTSAR